jgi:hypothetical protein
MTRRRNPTPPGEYWAHCQIGKHKGKLVLSSLNLDENIPLKQIGKGHFAVAYQRLDMLDEVVVVTKDDTYDKNILAEAHADDPDNPHIPAVVMRGHTDEKSIYTIPWYKAPLRKGDSAKAWAQYTAIKKCLTSAWDTTRKRRGRETDGRLTFEGHAVADLTVECARAAKVSARLCNALESIQGTMANYGASYVFEFVPRNLATDAKGNLVLLDPMFDMEVVQKNREAAQRERERVAAMRHAAHWGGRR